MWVVLHTPSCTWDHGDSNILTFWAEHYAKRECPNEAWQPHPVVLMDKSEYDKLVKAAKQ